MKVIYQSDDGHNFLTEVEALHYENKGQNIKTLTKVIEGTGLTCQDFEVGRTPEWSNKGIATPKMLAEFCFTHQDQMIRILKHLEMKQTEQRKGS